MIHILRVGLVLAFGALCVRVAFAVPPGEGRVEQMGKTRTVEGMKVYTVGIWQQNRESLWTIAGKLYGDPWQWKKIFQANEGKIQDPRTLYPKQELVIP